MTSALAFVPTIIQLAITFNIACIAVSSIKHLFQFLLKGFYSIDRYNSEYNVLVNRIRIDTNSLYKEHNKPITINGQSNKPIIKDAKKKYGLLLKNIKESRRKIEQEIDKTYNPHHLSPLCCYCATWGVIMLFLISASSVFKNLYMYIVYFAFTTLCIFVLFLCMFILKRIFQKKETSHHTHDQNAERAIIACSHSFLIILATIILSCIAKFFGDICVSNGNFITLDESHFAFTELFIAFIPFLSFVFYFFEMLFTTKKHLAKFITNEYNLLNRRHQDISTTKKALDDIQKAHLAMELAMLKM